MYVCLARMCALLTPQKMSRTHTHIRYDKPGPVLSRTYVYNTAPYRTYYPVRIVKIYWKPRNLGTPRSCSYLGYKCMNTNLENMERMGSSCRVHAEPKEFPIRATNGLQADAKKTLAVQKVQGVHDLALPGFVNSDAHSVQGSNVVRHGLLRAFIHTRR